MGKRAKKKVQGGPASHRTGAGSKSSSSSSSSSPSSSSTGSPSDSGLLMENGAAVDNSRCPHGANVDKLRTQLAKSAAIHCQDCAKLRSAVSAGKQLKGNNKVVRKKPPSSSSLGVGDEKKANNKLWICLTCGQVGCGEWNSTAAISNGGGELSKNEAKQGVVGKGHAWQHYMQLKHAMVMLCGDEFSCWCFQCEEANEVPHDHDVPLESGNPETGNPETLELEDDEAGPPSKLMLLQQSAKLLREKLAEQIVEVRVNSKETQNGHNGSEGAEKPYSPNGLVNGVHGVPDKCESPTSTRVIKGLINLGNTCFFNSVMQNLLSVELLRNHFGPESCLPEGALTSALRKFYLEASFPSPSEVNGLSEAGMKKGTKARGGWSSIDGTYNPKGLFGAICSKAPRFKGFQQQDSHELLRCLLDGLHTEEEKTWKASPKSKSGDGEAALRALSETDPRANGSNTEVDDAESSSQDSEGTADSDVCERKATSRHETFVERVFGGRLSSTVSCCECGHSSVVYESFLDLSLPIPAKRPSPKVLSVANGAVVTQSNSERALSRKNSKVKTKADSDSESFRSVPAGLGSSSTPLLLLPPPLPKENNCASLNTSTEAAAGWLDYVDPSTGPGETDWLDFLDDNRDVDCGAIVGCAPNPESQIVMNGAYNLESEIVFGCAPNQDFIMQSLESSIPSDSIVFGCTPNPGFIKQSLESSIASDNICISFAPGDSSRRSAEYQKGDIVGGAGSFSMANGHSTKQSLDTPLGETFLLLEAATAAVGEAKNPAFGCGSAIRATRGQEIDMQVQMRGGSEIQTLDSSQETNLNSYPVSEQLTDFTNFTVEQYGDCSGDTSTQSDIVDGPHGTVILLGPPIDTSNFSNLELEGEGEYDGVGSLFEEEETGEEKGYGPLPLHHDATFQDSSYDDMYDDVLDLSKISSEARGDWTASHESGQADENDETSTSIEGCLQIFTRSELLSGENAWACENCTKQYYEELAIEGRLAVMPERLFETSPQRALIKKSYFDHGSDYCGNESSKGGSVVDLISCDREVESNGDSCFKPEESSSSSIGEAAEMDPSALRGMNGPVNCTLSSPSLGSVDVGKDIVGKKETTIENGQMGQEDDASSQDSFEPVDILGAVKISQPPAEIKQSDDLRMLLGTHLEDFANGIGGEEVDNDRPEAGTNSCKAQKKGCLGNARNSGTTSKLKKSKSRKGGVEEKKVIKRDATKRFLISRAPPVFTIQLKRFAQDMRGRLSKLGGHIAFQEWLDLHPFLDHRSVNSETRFRLIGTVEHSGTLKSGHYVAYVRGPPSPSSTGVKNDTGTASDGASSWYYISDSHVSQTNLNAVLQSEAYLVFYERVDTIGLSH